MIKKRKAQLRALNLIPLREARADLRGDWPMPPKSETRMFLAEIVSEILEGKDVRRHFFHGLAGESPRPFATGEEEYALARCYEVAAVLAPDEKVTSRMAGLAGAAFGNPSRVKKIKD